MNWLEWTGVVALGVLSLVPLYIVYHIIRGVILAFDYARWCCAVNKRKANPIKVTLGIFLTIWSRKIIEMIGFNGEVGITAYHADDGSSWTGYGTGR